MASHRRQDSSESTSDLETSFFTPTHSLSHWQSLPVRRTGSAGGENVAQSGSQPESSSQGQLSSRVDSGSVRQMHPTGSRSFPVEGSRRGSISYERSLSGGGSPLASLRTEYLSFANTESVRRRGGSSRGGSSSASPPSPATPPTPSRREWNIEWPVLFLVLSLGTISLVLGALAENKMPERGTLVKEMDDVFCQHRDGPSFGFGYLSLLFLIASAYAGRNCLFYPYQGKSLPRPIFFKMTLFRCFYWFAWILVVIAALFLFGASSAQLFYLRRGADRDVDNPCRTAENAFFNIGAVFSFCSSLFWLACLSLACTIRDDYFHEVTNQGQGQQGDIV